MAKFAFLTSGPTKTVARFQQLVKRYAFRLKNHNIVAYYAIWIWGLFEIILCATVLLTRKHEYTENFLFDLCPITDPTCSHFIVKALIGRVVVSVLLLIGNITGFNCLMLPWFLVNALGIFPLLPVVVSSFYRYESVYKYVSAQANAIHVLAKIVKALLLINDP